MYFSAKEILAQLDGTDMRICDLVIKNETEISEISREEIFRCWKNAIRSCTIPLTMLWKKKSVL